jgi:hypothetical protein
MAGTTEKEVLELLRSRIERRFRPDASRWSQTEGFAPGFTPRGK